MSTVADRLLPKTTDPDTAGFFEAAARGELAVNACRACTAVLHPPRAYCHHCGSWETEWRAVAAQGRLYSWTTIEHQAHPSFPTPYTVLLVELDDAPEVRLTGWVAGAPELTPGQAVEFTFEDVGDGVVLPQMRIPDGETIT